MIEIISPSKSKIITSIIIVGLLQIVLRFTSIELLKLNICPEGSNFQYAESYMFSGSYICTEGQLLVVKITQPLLVYVLPFLFSYITIGFWERLRINRLLILPFVILLLITLFLITFFLTNLIKNLTT
jgi:hypothetical protein